MQSRFYNAINEIRKQKIGAKFSDSGVATNDLARITRVQFWEKLANAVSTGTPRYVRLTQSNPTCWQVHGYNVDLGSGKWTEIDLFHVLAHRVQPPNTAYHGPEFIKLFLSLVERYIGKDEKRRVKEILLAHKVRTKTVNADARAAQRDRYFDRQAPAAKENLRKILADLEGM